MSITAYKNNIIAHKSKAAACFQPAGAKHSSVMRSTAFLPLHLFSQTPLSKTDLYRLILLIYSLNNLDFSIQCLILQGLIGSDEREREKIKSYTTYK